MNNETKFVVNGKGLVIKPVDGDEFIVEGKVTYKDYADLGIVYYCAGQSWPAEIVTGVQA